MTTLILYILFCHWIADFVCQSRWMGNNKSSDRLAMLAHIETYTFTLLSMLYIPLILTQQNWLAFPIFVNITAYGILCYGMVNMALHYVTDSISSKTSKYFWSKGQEHNFWVTIGFDQFAHNVALISTTSLLFL